MVNEQEQHSGRRSANQGVRDVNPEPNRINASTPYDFNGKNLTPYGGLLPVVTMLEKLGFESLVEETVTSKRTPRAMDLYRFVLGIVLGLYIGFPRLNQLRFIARDPILTGILKVTKLPVQSTFWRFVNALHRNVARQMLIVMRTMRQRVWEAANVKLEVVTIDTDTTVHTLYGQQTGGRRYWPIHCRGVEVNGERLIDTDGIRRDRDQLWAEALMLYRHGTKWWLEDPEVIQLAAEEQRGRYIEDPWHQRVITHAQELAERIIAGYPQGRGSASVSEILGLLGLDATKQDQTAANRVARCLKSDGWERANLGPRGAREWRYRKVFQS